MRDPFYRLRNPFVRMCVLPASIEFVYQVSAALNACHVLSMRFQLETTALRAPRVVILNDLIQVEQV